MSRQSHKAIDRILKIGSMTEAEAKAFFQNERNACMSMTDDQLSGRLRAIRRTAESLNGGGYTTDKGGISEAAWDVRFLLAHIDGLNIRISDMTAHIATPPTP